MTSPRYYECWQHGVQAGDHCPQCVVHAFIPPGLGPLPERKPAREDVELDANLRRQALECHRLRRVVEVLDQYPTDGAIAARILKLAVLEFSKQLRIMQRVAEETVALSASPVPLSTIIERVTREVGE